MNPESCSWTFLRPALPPRPVITVDARQDAEYKATSIRASDGKPLGSYRWLVWAVFPINDSENTAFQELQVIPAR
jgi:hypothetical protein